MNSEIKAFIPECCVRGDIPTKSKRKEVESKGETAAVQSTVVDIMQTTPKEAIDFWEDKNIWKSVANAMEAEQQRVMDDFLSIDKNSTAPAIYNRSFSKLIGDLGYDYLPDKLRVNIGRKIYTIDTRNKEITCQSNI